MSIPDNTSPLTPRERRKAERTQAYFVWYDDRFHSFEDSDPAHIVLATLDKAEADAYAARRPLPVSGGDGYEVSGPHALLFFYDRKDLTADQVRILLVESRKRKRQMWLKLLAWILWGWWKR